MHCKRTDFAGFILCRLMMAFLLFPLIFAVNR